MVSHLVLLPWCTAITGYRISSNNSNSQQQPITSYRKTSKLLLGVSWPTSMKTTTNRICAWQFKHVNTLSHVWQWFNLWLYCWDSLLPVDKRSVTSCVMWNLPQFIRILRVLSRILATYTPIILWLYYATNYSQLILYKIAAF